jgi:hypothetical protein
LGPMACGAFSHSLLTVRYDCAGMGETRREDARERVRRLRQKLEAKNGRIEGLRHQLEARDREIEDLRARLARVDDPAKPADRDAPVFFLVGQAKSGTSWLMRMLDSHPEILCKGEGRLFGLDYKREDIRKMPSKTLQPSSLHAAILDAAYLEAWVERSVWTRDEDKGEHLAGLTHAAIAHFLTGRLSKTGKRVVGDKTPFLGETTIQEIADVYPEAKVLHIIRDGRDVAVSWMHHLWNHTVDLVSGEDLTPGERATREAYREDPEKVLGTAEGLFAEQRLRAIAESWRTQVTRAMHDGPRLLGDNYAEARYEDLTEAPEREVRRLLEFLGAASDDETVKRCVSRESFERRARGRARGQEDSTAFLRKGVAGDWKNVFTEENRRVFEAAAGGLLVDLGYEQDRGW